MNSEYQTPIQTLIHECKFEQLNHSPYSADLPNWKMKLASFSLFLDALPP